MKKKQLIVAFALSLCILILYGCGMKNLPVGDYIKSSVSPDNTYQINVYRVNGGATTDFAVRCEVETISSGEKRNIINMM